MVKKLSNEGLTSDNELIKKKTNFKKWLETEFNDLKIINLI